MKVLFFFLAPLVLTALPLKPWFGRLWEFEAKGEYSLGYYPAIQNGKPSSHYSSTDQLALLSLGVAPTSLWDLSAEAEFAETRKNSWGFCSIAFQGRRLWLDDVVGDPISLTTNLLIRAVSHRFLKDPSCMYHGDVSLEGGISLGKEHAEWADWSYRGFGYLGLGVGNRGSPYSRAVLTFEKNDHDFNRYEARLSTLVGFGDRHQVNTEDFHGYSSIHYRLVDLSLVYHRIFAPYGKLSVEITRRVFARSCPERLTSISLFYTLPFSFF